MQQRYRVKIIATADPDLLSEVDAYLGRHPEADRSGVIDEALALWVKQRQDQAMIGQFAGPGAPEQEARHCCAVRQAAAPRLVHGDE